MGGQRRQRGVMAAPAGPGPVQSHEAGAGSGLSPELWRRLWADGVLFLVTVGWGDCGDGEAAFDRAYEGGGGSVFVFDFIEIVFDCICVFDRIRVFDCISSVLIVSWPPVPGHPHRSGGLLEG